MNTVEEINAKSVQTGRSMGIFQIRNKVSHKIYVGCSDHLNSAWASHKDRLNQGVHPNGGLQSDYHKMGPDNFEFEIIEQFLGNENDTENTKTLNDLEKTVLEKLQPYYDKGYNRTHA